MKRKLALILLITFGLIATTVLGQRTTGGPGVRVGGEEQYSDFMKLIGTTLAPQVTTYKLGDATYPWANGYFTALTVTTLSTDTTVAGDFTIQANTPTLIFDEDTASETDAYIGINADNVGDDNDPFQMGLDKTLGTRVFFQYDDGVFTLASVETGGNLEDITLDLETTANQVTVGTGTGVTIWDWGTIDLATDALDLSEGNITNVGTITLDLIDADATAIAIGNNDETVAIDSSDWDISTTGVITGVSFDADGTGNSITNIEDADIKAGAEIAVAKLANGTARQVLQTDAAGTGVEWTSDLGTSTTIGTAYIYRVGGTDVSVADGGTGASSLTDGGILLGSGTGAITATAVLANGELLIGDGTTDPTIATLTGTANQISITNGAGSITLSTPQDIATASTPTFGGITLNGTTTLDNTGTNVNSPAISLKGDSAGVEEEGQIQLMYGADPYIRISVDDDSTTPVLTGVVDFHDQVISFVNDNTTDIGASGANRPKDIYAAGNITAGGTITGATINQTGLTASRLVSTDGSKNLASVANLASWIAGTANEITVADDGDGTITIGLPDAVTIGTDLTVTDQLIVSGAGPHVIGGNSLNYVRNYLTGNFTSGGGSTVGIAVAVDGTLTGAAGDTTYLAAVNVQGAITTQGNTETIADVVSVRISEPNITIGTGDTITNAATLKIINAPTEATNNYALWVDSGTTRLDGDIDLSAATVDVTLNNAVDALNFDSNTLSIDALNGRVGVGTTVPSEPLHVYQDSSNNILKLTRDSSGTFYDNIFYRDTGGFGIIGNNASTVIMYLTDSGDVDFRNTSNSVINKFSVSGDSYITGGNVGIGTTTFGTSAAGVLGLGNGTAPTSSPADMVQLYAVDYDDGDATATSELFVRDEDGNATNLSQHANNIAVVGLAKSPTYPAVRIETQHYAGIRRYTANGRLAELVDELAHQAGLLAPDEHIVVYEDIESEDFDAQQQAIADERQAEIDAFNQRRQEAIAAHDAWLASKQANERAMRNWKQAYRDWSQRRESFYANLEQLQEQYELAMEQWNASKRAADEAVESTPMLKALRDEWRAAHAAWEQAKAAHEAAEARRIKPLMKQYQRLLRAWQRRQQDARLLGEQFVELPPVKPAAEPFTQPEPVDPTAYAVPKPIPPDTEFEPAPVKPERFTEPEPEIPSLDDAPEPYTPREKPAWIRRRAG